CRARIIAGRRCGSKASGTGRGVAENSAARPVSHHGSRNGRGVMPDLKDKSTIVTGAGSGIGLAIAERLVADGARVVVSDLNREAADAVARRLGDAARACAADVADEDAVARLVDFAVRELGGLDAMVNNAGIGEDDVPIDQKPSADWQRIIGINLTGAF